MSIRRARLPFEGQYVQIPNTWMRDNRISRRARGLLAEIMTHSEDWIISQNALWKGSPEGREAVRKAVLELVEAGYLKADQQRGAQGRFGEVNYVLTAPDLADSTATQKLGNGRKTGVRSTAPQKTTPKEEHIEEDQGKKGTARPSPVGNSIALTPPARTCKRHAANSDVPCRDCGADRVAQLMWEQTLVAGSRDDHWVPTPQKPSKAWRSGLCIPHLQRVGACEMCVQEARA